MILSITNKIVINTALYSEMVIIYRGGYRRSLKLNNIENETNLYVDSA